MVAVAVVVFPDGAGDAGSGDPAARQRVVSNTAGAFAFADLPSGSYRMAVADEMTLADWPEPGLLARLATTSVPVVMTATGGVALRLVVSGEPGIRHILRSEMARSRIEVLPSGGRRGPPGGARGRLTSPGPTRPAGASSVTGVVTARGVPIAGITVALLLPRTVNGVREFARLGEPAITDQNGRYELTGVRAGTFAVVAFARALGPETLLGGASPAATPADAGSEDVLATTFYPAAIHAAGTTTIALVDNERREGINIDMQWAPALLVAGVVAAAAGPPPFNLRAVLLPADPADHVGGQNVRWASVGPDGRFEFRRVPVGEYELAINGGPNGWARRRVQASSGLGELSIELQAPFTIDGRIEFRSTGRAAQPGDPMQVTIRLMPERLQAGATVPTAHANADGSFVLRGTPGGRYRLQATTTEGWIQTSGMLGAMDTLDAAVAVASDRGDALVVMVDAETAVLGLVTSADDRPVTEGRVVVFSADRAHWRSGNRRVSVLRLTPNGTFSLSGLPAGEYFAAFIPAAVTGPVTNRTLDALTPDATPFLLAEGEQKRISVRVK